MRIKGARVQNVLRKAAAQSLHLHHTALPQDFATEIELKKSLDTYPFSIPILLFLCLKLISTGFNLTLLLLSYTRRA